MAYELTNGGGTIFHNKFKKAGERTPDLKGEAMWRDEKLEIALWEKTSRDGQKYYSVKLQEPREKPASAPARVPGSASTPIDMSDEIPF